MKKTRMEKGITLVALVITVVVLLILAGVAISTINETGIIAKSNNAAHKFNASQAGESENLVGYEDLIGKYDGSGNKGTVTILAGTYYGNHPLDCQTEIDQNITFIWGLETWSGMFTSGYSLNIVDENGDYGGTIYDMTYGESGGFIYSDPIIITEDQEVSAEFAEWFNANFTKVQHS